MQIMVIILNELCSLMKSVLTISSQKDGESWRPESLITSKYQTLDR